MDFQVDTNYGNRSVYYCLTHYFVEKNPEEYQCKLLLCYSGDICLELLNS